MKSSTRWFPTLRGTIAAGALGIMAAGANASAAETSSFLGTWVLNVSRSPNTGLTSETMTVTDAGGGSLHVILTQTSTEGASSRLEYASAGDNKPVTVTGSPAADAIRVKQDAKSATFAFLKGGKRVRWGTLTVSADGKSLQGGATAALAKGKRVKSTLIFDRQ